MSLPDFNAKVTPAAKALDLEGFKKFVMRGNLIEMAIAFIMGAAFNGVVKSFTDIIMGIISKVIGGPPNFDAFQPLGLPVGVFITQVISLLLVALVLYYGLVLPISKLRRKEEVVEEAKPTEAELLTEIRDLLAAQNSAK